MTRQGASISADTQFAFTSDGPWSSEWKPGMEFTRVKQRFGVTRFTRWSDPVKLVTRKPKSDNDLGLDKKVGSVLQ